MRSIRMKIAIAILAILVVGIGTAYYLLTTDHSADEETVGDVTITDPDGNSYLVVEDDDGVTYAAVTDANGNIYAAEVNPDGTIGDIIGDITGQVDIDSIPTTVATTTTSVTESAESTTASSSSDSSEDVTTTTSSSNSSADSTTTTSSSSANSSTDSSSYDYKINMYQDILASGTFILEFYTNDEDFGTDPVYLATKDGSILMETTIDLDDTSYECSMLYVASKDKTYLIMPVWSKYFDLPSSMMEDMDMSSLLDGFSEVVDIADITVSTVTEDGVTYTVETYINGEGLEVKYYFNGDEWVRREITEADGTVSITYVIQATGTVADSVFDIPSGYGYLNLSWLDWML